MQRFERSANDYEFGAAIFCPGGLIVARINRPVLAITDGLDAGRIDVQAAESFAHCQGAPFAQGAIVFSGATLVAMTFNEQLGTGAAFAIFGHRLDLRLLERIDRGAVVRKMHGLKHTGLLLAFETTALPQRFPHADVSGWAAPHDV